jgi:putative transposase
MIRTEAQLTVSRFCELIGMSRRSFYAQRERHRVGDRAKGPWPTPALDAVEAAATRIAAARPEWGHRKVWAQLREQGDVDVSPSSVQRALARRIVSSTAGAGDLPTGSEKHAPNGG